MPQAGGAPPAPAVPTPPADPAAQAVTNLEHVVGASPKLAKVPGAALDAATGGGNVANSAVAVTHMGNAHVLAQAATAVTQSQSPAEQKKSGGFFGILDSIGHGVSDIVTHPINDAKQLITLPFNMLNAGMKDAQHQFRYLYDVERRHGPMAMFGELATIIGAAAAGAALTTGGVLATPLAGGASDVAAAAGDAALAAGTEVALEGAAAGTAEATAGDVAGQVAGKSLLKTGFKLAGKLTRGLPPKYLVPGMTAGYAQAHVLYTDSWNRTASATYTAPNGMLVNPGNLVAGGLGMHGGIGNMVSGTANAIFDLAFDPVNANLSDMSYARKVAGMAAPSRVIGKSYDRVMGVENLDKLYQGGLEAERAGKWDPRLPTSCGGWIARLALDTPI